MQESENSKAEGRQAATLAWNEQGLLLAEEGPVFGELQVLYGGNLSGPKREWRLCHLGGMAAWDSKEKK